MTNTTTSQPAGETQYQDAWTRAARVAPARRIFDIIRNGRFTNETLEVMRVAIHARCTDSQIAMVNASIQNCASEAILASILRKYVQPL